MTICIGIVAQDGIVIAADAQESDSYFKRGQQKILTWHVLGLGSGPQPPPAGCVITGAGDAGFIDSFTHKLLASVKGSMTIQTFQAHLENEIAAFYGRHVAPILSSNPESDFQMLIGVYFGFASALFVTYRSTVRRAMPTVAIGAATFGMRMLEEMPYVPEVNSLEIIAAHVIATTKDCIEGCGKYTDIVSASQLRNSGGNTGGGRFTLRTSPTCDYSRSGIQNRPLGEELCEPLGKETKSVNPGAYRPGAG